MNASTNPGVQQSSTRWTNLSFAPPLLPLLTLLALLMGTPGYGQEPNEPPAKATDARPDFETLHLRGRIVWLSEALERRFGVATVAEADERVLVLEARDGTLYPIVEDVRGRSLRRDERLRNLKDVELMVRRYEQSPFVQIIRIYSHEDGKRVELDYWCEICAIAMFELKACDCCQGPIELRKRPAPPQIENPVEKPADK